MFIIALIASSFALTIAVDLSLTAGTEFTVNGAANNAVLQLTATGLTAATACTVGASATSCTFGLATLNTFLASGTASAKIVVTDGTNTVDLTAAAPTAMTGAVKADGSYDLTLTGATGSYYFLQGAAFVSKALATDVLNVLPTDIKAVTLAYQAVGTNDKVLVYSKAFGTASVRSASGATAVIIKDTVGKEILNIPAFAKLVDTHGSGFATKFEALTASAAGTDFVYTSGTVTGLPASYQVQGCTGQTDGTCAGSPIQVGTPPGPILTITVAATNASEVFSIAGSAAEKKWTLKATGIATDGAACTVATGATGCKFGFDKIEAFIASGVATSGVTLTDGTANIPLTAAAPAAINVTEKLTVLPAGTVQIEGPDATADFVYNNGTAFNTGAFVANKFVIPQAALKAKTVLIAYTSAPAISKIYTFAPAAASVRSASLAENKVTLTDTLGYGFKAPVPTHLQIEDTHDAGYATAYIAIATTAGVNNTITYTTAAITTPALPASFKVAACTGNTTANCATEKFQVGTPPASAFSVVASALLLLLAFAL